MGTWDVLVLTTQACTLARMKKEMARMNCYYLRLLKGPLNLGEGGNLLAKVETKEIITSQ